MTQTERLEIEPERTARPAVHAAGFRSVLFSGEDAQVIATEEPSFFADLNLDQVIAEVVAGRDEYHLKPFFRASGAQTRPAQRVVGRERLIGL